MNSEFTNEFVEWVLLKFKLPSLRQFVNQCGWQSNTIYIWKNRGIPKQFTIVLQEKLINQRIVGRIGYEQKVNLGDLFKEYQIEKENGKKII